MKARIYLSHEAHERLVQFCHWNLNPSIDPETYADNMDPDMSGPTVIFEIPARHNTYGHVVSISFSDDDDFIWEEFE